MSAKSGEGVNLCFQKIAAELLGIRLVIIYEYGIFNRFILIDEVLYYGIELFFVYVSD